MFKKIIRLWIKLKCLEFKPFSKIAPFHIFTDKRIVSVTLQTDYINLSVLYLNTYKTKNKKLDIYIYIYITQIFIEISVKPL
jgi:hypothetical protein